MNKGPFNPDICCGDWYVAIQNGTIKSTMGKSWFDRDWKIYGQWLPEFGMEIRFCPFCGKKKITKKGA